MVQIRPGVCQVPPCQRDFVLSLPRYVERFIWVKELRIENIGGGWEEWVR
jgi:hypothetical protein